MEDPLDRLARGAGIVAGGRPLGELPARPVRLLVLGERHRGDDGVTFAAARRALATLDASGRALVELRETGQLDPADLVEIPAGGAAVVVDAVVGVPPGSVIVVPLERLGDLAAGRAPRDCLSAVPRSTHVLPVEQLVALAAALRGGAPPGVLVGIGGGSFDLGAAPSAEVDASLDELVERIGAELVTALRMVRAS